MAAKPIPEHVREAVLIDWRMGQLSQREIAKKHAVSAGYVGRLCVGIERDGEQYVAALLVAKQEVKALGGRMEAAIVSECERRVAMQAFFEDATVRNITLMMEKVETTDSIAQHRMAQTAIKEGRETVLGRAVDTVVNVNNTQQTAVVTGLSLSVSHERLRSIHADLDSEY